jgi:hypothetical protein
MVGMFSMVGLSSAHRRRRIENLRRDVVMNGWLFLVHYATYESGTQQRLLVLLGTQPCRPILLIPRKWGTVQTRARLLYMANHQQID